MGAIDAPTRITSLDQFVSTYGARLSAAPLGYDSVDAYFHVGGGAVYFMRCVDGATVATGDATAVATGGTLNAASPGTFGAGLKLDVVTAPTLFAVESEGKGKSKSAPEPERSEFLTYPEATAAGQFMATVSLAGTVVATSPTIATIGDLRTWLAAGPYLRLVGGTDTGAVTVGSVTLGGGTDGTLPTTPSGNAVPTALAAIPKTLGPGQVAAPGKSSLNEHGAVLSHASLNNRVALLDGAKGEDVTTLKADAASLRGTLQDRYGSMWAPWAIVPGVAPGTTRVIPWSGIEAGLCAANDAGGNPNQAVAGAWGAPPWVLGLNQTFSPTDCETLLYAGVNTARLIYGEVQAYAFRTLVDPNGVRAGWLELNWARCNMAIVADSEAVAQDYVFAQLDGRGHTIAAFGGALQGVLIGYYNIDALFGDDVTEAFLVNVGPQVNTVDKLSQGILSAVLEVRMSPHAELVQIYIVKQPITVALV